MSTPPSDPGPRYLDSEDQNEHIRAQVRALAGLRYDHDGHGALPLRSDVQGYLLDTLCPARTGLIQAGGVDLPVVRSDRDGTLTLFWTEGGRRLKLHIPTRDVLIADRIEADALISLRLGRAPGRDADELERMFAWLRDEDD